MVIHFPRVAGTPQGWGSLPATCLSWTTTAVSDEQTPGEGNPPDPLQSQELQHSQISARVPEHVGPGVFSTGVIVMHGVHEFVLDFVMSLSPPRRIASRVVLPPTVVPLFIGALRDNLQKYHQAFGAPPKLPPPPAGATPPPITDVYEQLKVPDTIMSGVYANTVMVVHSPAEFCFDFITSFYPRSAVAARVFLAAAHVPQFYDSLFRSWEQYRTKQQQRPPEPPPAEPGTEGDAEPKDPDFEG